MITYFVMRFDIQQKWWYHTNSFLTTDVTLENWVVKGEIGNGYQLGLINYSLVCIQAYLLSFMVDWVELGTTLHPLPAIYLHQTDKTAI